MLIPTVCGCLQVVQDLYAIVACSVYSPPCQFSKGFKRLFCLFFIDKSNFISIALLSRYRGIGSLMLMM